MCKYSKNPILVLWYLGTWVLFIFFVAGETPTSLAFFLSRARRPRPWPFFCRGRDAHVPTWMLVISI